MTATTTFTAPTTRRIRTTSVWKTGVGAGLAASAATVGVAGLARPIDIPLAVGGEFVVTTIVLTAMSIVPDVLADAQTATRLVLALTHVVAAAIVIPALASRLPVRRAH